MLSNEVSTRELLQLHNGLKNQQSNNQRFILPKIEKNPNDCYQNVNDILLEKALQKSNCYSIYNTPIKGRSVSVNNNYKYKEPDELETISFSPEQSYVGKNGRPGQMTVYENIFNQLTSQSIQSSILDNEQYQDCPFCQSPVLKVHIIDHIEQCRLLSQIDNIQSVYEQELKWATLASTIEDNRYQAQLQMENLREEQIQSRYIVKQAAEKDQQILLNEMFMNYSQIMDKKRNALNRQLKQRVQLREKNREAIAVTVQRFNKRIQELKDLASEEAYSHGHGGGWWRLFSSYNMCLMCQDVMELYLPKIKQIEKDISNLRQEGKQIERKENELDKKYQNLK